MPIASHKEGLVASTDLENNEKLSQLWKEQTNHFSLPVKA
jgi:hypothetical protein